MKSISLRRAAKVRSKLDSLISEQLKNANKISLTVDISDTDIVDQIMSTNDERAEAMIQIHNLVRLRQAIRAALGRANAANGLSDRLAEISANDSILAIYRGYQYNSALAGEAQLSPEKITNRIQTRKQMLSNESVSVNGTSMAFNVLTQSDIDAIESEIETLVNRNDVLADEIESINTTAVIALEDEIVSSLTTFGITL